MIAKRGVSSCSVNPPIWKSEKPQGWQVVHCASEAAIFMLCAPVTASPKRFPTTSCSSVTGTATINASFAAIRNKSTSRPRRNCQQQIPSITIDPKIRPASIVCTYARSANPFDRSAHTLVSCASPSTILYPTGCCIHEFATRMKYPDSHDPRTAIHSVARCTRGDRRFQPKIHSPRNVASSMNAASPSIASGAPKMFPTNLEYTDQFIPNWNSCTSPVATPIAKLISNSAPKKRVSRSQRSSRVRCHNVCITATSGPSPSVNGTNKKW